MRRNTNPQLEHYHRTWLPKRRGGFRLIEMPKARIKAVQRRVLRCILDAIPTHRCAEGFVPGRSAMSHALRHSGQAAVLCLDLEDFFTSSRPHTLTNCLRHGAETQNHQQHADFRAHLQGRVAWVEAVAPARGAKLRALFDAISWPA